MDFYSDDQRELQDQFETRTLADTLEASIVHSEIPDEHAAFIGSRDFFFLSTVNDAGEPTVSYKGGPAGVVKVLDSKTLAFPIYDGNGMFLSAGNINAANKIGLLFMDFETPHRVRVQASALLSDSAEDLGGFPGALIVAKATVDACFVNCGRYIHKHNRVETSKHVPDADGQQPLALWKRIDVMQDSLSPRDQGRAEAEGGLVTSEEYGVAIQEGES